MKKLPFSKMSGSGNDFVVIDNWTGRLRPSWASLAARLCHRQFGVGADGLLVLEPAANAAFRMRYFNADGSRASMCGNGARCIAWAAHEKGLVDGTFDFQTDAGVVQGRVDKDVVEVTLGDAFDYRPQFKVTAAGRAWPVSFINTGVPHAVIEVPNVERIDLQSVGRAIRFHKAFGPKGANVNFIQRTGANRLRVRTYERGVEGETLACGTGVTAGAIVAAMRHSNPSSSAAFRSRSAGFPLRRSRGPSQFVILRGRKRRTHVYGNLGPRLTTAEDDDNGRMRVFCKTTGGDTLEVNFNIHPQDSKHPATAVTLKGPVRRTFVGEVEL